MNFRAFAVAATLIFGVGSSLSSAAVLAFGKIDGGTDVTASLEIRCTIPGMPTAACELTRNSFGDVYIKHSMVLANNSTRRVTDVSIWIDDLFEANALKALIARYGPPLSDAETPKVNSTGGPFKSRVVTWPKFEEGAQIIYIRSEKSAFLSFSWPANRETPAKPKIDF